MSIKEKRKKGKKETFVCYKDNLNNFRANTQIKDFFTNRIKVKLIVSTGHVSVYYERVPTCLKALCK